MLEPRRGMSRAKIILMVVTICLSSTGVIADMVLTPIANELYTTFAGQEMLVSFGYTGVMLIGLPAMFICGPLCDRIDKKKMLVVAYAIFSIGSCCGGLVANAVYFAVMRAILCIGYGMLNTCNFAILSDFFEDDEEEHGRVVGWYSASISIIGAALAFASGLLAVNGWQASFAAYLINIPIFIMIILFVPSFPPKKKAEDASVAEEIAENAKSIKGWWTALIPLCLMIIFVVTSWDQILYLLSLFVADAGIGDTVFTGTAASIITITGIFGSILFGSAYKRMGKWVYIPTLVLMGLGFLAMYFWPTKAVTIAVCAILGFLYPFFYCYFYTHYSEIVPAEKVGTASSIIGVVEAIAFSCCSYVLFGVEALMGTESSVPTWPVFGTVVLIVAAIAIVINIVRRNGKAKDSEAAGDVAEA